MPADEYTTPSPGGLKLKGAAPSGIVKKKKKAKKDKDKISENQLDRALNTEVEALAKPEKKPEQGELPTEPSKAEDEDDESDTEADGKTEAERKYEEMRRKRLNERLKKEGAKPHKQRVEEFNKYLSNLSEHHDMPRIGPG